MGVSVSYNGSGGRRSFNLDGVPTGDAAKTLGLPQKKHYVPDTLKKMLQMPAPTDPIEEAQKGKVKLNNLDANPGTLAEKVLPGGGVVVSQGGVCLRGEEQSPLVTGVQLFGSVMGSKKYHTIEEIDPPGTPRHVGAQNADEDPAPNNEPAKVGEPYKYQVTSRIVAERDAIAKLLKFYELDKDISVSPAGRTTGVTKERRRMIVAIRDTSAARDEFLHPFEVRWSESENSGSGAWVIWLPSTSLLVSTGPGTWANITGGITAAQGLPAGWYTCDIIPAASSAPSCWLVVEKTESTGAFSARIDEMAGQSQTGVKTWNFKIAAMTSNSTTGEKSVKQLVDSVVTLGGEGGDSIVPDGVSTELIPDPPAGTQPGGDEGKLQIKDWKDPNASVDQHTLSDYLQGAVVGGGGSNYQVLVRAPQVGASPALGYVPIGELFKDTSGGGQPQDKTVEFVADIDWYVSGSTHVLRKRLRVLNLRTGAVTDKANTTYANGWQIATNTTPITSIIN